MTHTTLPPESANATPSTLSQGPGDASALSGCGAPRAAGAPTILTHGAVAQRAHDLYVKSGYRPGQSDENWLRAEADLLERRTAACQAEHRILSVFAPDARAL